MLPCPANAVTRDFHPIANHHDVGGLQVAVDAASRVDIVKGVQNGIHHLARFHDRERPASKNVRKDFLGIFHDGVVQPHSI